jgi:hypothetical protein
MRSSDINNIVYYFIRQTIHNQMPRGLNVSKYRYHIHGKLCNHTIDDKFTSLNQFLEQYGGTKTCLNLNRTKLYRIRKRWIGNTIKPECMSAYKTSEYQNMKDNWGLTIDDINEKRKKKITRSIVYFD